MSKDDVSPLLEVRRYAARPDAEIAAWALRASGVAAELRRIAPSQVDDVDGGSALLVPRDDVIRARDVLSSNRFRMSDDEERQTPATPWFPVQPSEIVAGLAQIQRRERIARFWVWGVVVVFLAGFVFPAALLSGIGIVWFAGVGIARWRASSCDCPRCGLPFGRDATLLGSWRAAVSKGCLTCGLSRHL